MAAQPANAGPSGIPPADPLDQTPTLTLDTETTGLDPAAGARIISIAAIRLPSETRAMLPPHHSTLILPPEGTAWNEEATRVHGHTEETLAKAGATDFPTAWNRLAPLLPPDADWIVLAHNAEFDHLFVANEFAAHRMPDHPVTDPRRWRCTLAWSRRRWPSATRHNLDAVSTRLKIPHALQRQGGATHDAAHDATILAHCWQLAREEAMPSAPDLFAAEHFETSRSTSADIPQIVSLAPPSDEDKTRHAQFSLRHGTAPLPGYTP